MKSKTVLATCYAVNPYKGSEDGMGWHFVNQIARFQKVIAITRENNRAAIEQYMQEHPSSTYDHITFLYFDLPYWMRFWKKGGRGAMLYYWMWQRGIVGFIKRQGLSYDVVHNLNFHNDWTPTYLYQLRKPLVWGPIGHHPKIPAQYLNGYPFSYWLKDRMTWVVKNCFWKGSFALKKAVMRADHILCMNQGVLDVLPLYGKSISITPSVATEDYHDGSIASKKEFSVISIGRFVPLKGFDLTLNAFIQFLQGCSEEECSLCHLTLVGSGPMQRQYESIIQEAGVQNYVTIIPWMERKAVMNLYRQSSVFLFPSHEGAGMVVAEALSFGLPVVCLDNEGPGAFINQDCGIAVPHGSYESTVQGLKNALAELFKNPDKLQHMSTQARQQYETHFTWESRGNQLQKIYDQVVCE